MNAINFTKEDETNKKLALLENDIKDPKSLKNKLIDLYLLEFEENFSDILTLDQEKYIDRFKEKMILVLTDKYSDKSFEKEEFSNLVIHVDNIFYENYYDVSFNFLKKQIKDFLETNSDNKSNQEISRRDSFNKKKFDEVNNGKSKVN